MTVPDKFSFPVALTHDQVQIGCSTTDGCAVTTRALMASLTQDSASLTDAWNSCPEAFMELVENAPAAIQKAEALLSLMKTAHARLMLTGHLALNGVDESEDIQEVNPQYEITFTVSTEEAALIDQFAEKWDCTRDVAATRLAKEALASILTNEPPTKKASP